MVYLSLKQNSFKQIRMKFEVEGDEDLSLESKFSFEVNYNDDNSACVAVLHQDVQLKDNPDKFTISVESIGHFICEGIQTEEDKKEAHIKSYLLLFPYVQDMIARLTVSAGLSPLFIECARLAPDDVVCSK